LKELQPKDLDNPDVQVVRMERSDYEELLKEYRGTNKKWLDLTFQPDETSLGPLPALDGSQWKRISDLLNKPALFDGKL
jgi:hypothetical protein